MKKYFAAPALTLSLFLSLLRPSYGAGGIGNDNPTGPTGEYNGSITTAGSYDPYTGNAKRFVDDLTVTGSVGAYPLKWTRILNTRGGMSTLGGGGSWRNSYQWGLSIFRRLNPYPPCRPDGPDAIVYYPDGRRMNLAGNGTSQPYYNMDAREQADHLINVGGEEYDLLLADGGRVQFRTVNGVLRVATVILDPYGLRTTLERDGSNRLWKITEPAGRYLEIHYKTDLSGLIDYVEARNGPEQHLMETVRYDYQSEVANAWGGPVTFYNLKHATYDDGSQATYEYFEATLATTYYGSMAPGRIRKCNDLRYAGAMSNIEYVYATAGGGNPGCLASYGQIREEKNMTTGQVVSSVNYPSGFHCTTGYFERTETRPDGATRIFQYSHESSPELVSYTDFSDINSHHVTTISYTTAGAPTLHYYKAITDARPGAYTTKTEKSFAADAVTAIIYPNGSNIQYHYTDPINPFYLDWKKDENDKKTHYDRICVVADSPCTDSNRNRVWRIRYPDNGIEEFTYNEFGQVRTHLMTSGGTEVFTYDSRGLKESYTPATTPNTDPIPHTTTYAYYKSSDGWPDRIDRLKSVTDPLNHVTTYEYNKRGQVTRVTHNDGETYTEKFYNHDGTLQWAEDELRHRTTYVYDEYKRLTSVRNALEEETQSSYAPWNGFGALSHTTASVYLKTLPSLKKIKYDYDNNFRLKETTEAPGTPLVSKTTYGYDEVGNQTSVRKPHDILNGGTFPEAVSVYGYNDRNRRTSFTDALGHTTSWFYDDVGNMKWEKRHDNKVRTWDEYDSMNRVKKTTGFLPQDVTRYDYEPTGTGNLEQITDCNGAMYSYRYDRQNRKVTAIYPTDAASTGANHRFESYRYDAAGNLRAYKNPAGQWKHFKYDDRNREWLSYWNNDEDDESAANLSIGDRRTTGHDLASRVRSIQTENSMVTYVGFDYDDANRKTTELQRIGSSANQNDRWVETPRDDDGNRRALKVEGVPSGYSFSYNYTDRQQLFHINKVVGQNESQFFEFEYDLNAHLIRRENMLQGHDSTHFQYDIVERVAFGAQKWRKPNGTTETFALSDYNDYDDINRLQSVSRKEDLYKGERFVYDAANQLHSVSYQADIGQRVSPLPVLEPAIGLAVAAPVVEPGTDWDREGFALLQPDPVREPLALAAIGMSDPGSDAPWGAPRTVTYTNDPINRRSMNDNNETVTEYTPNGLNQYTAVSGHSAPDYDTKFNLSGYGGWTYQYDADNRLVFASGGGFEARFLYDGLGRCVRRTIDGAVTRVTYDDWKPIVEWDSAGAFLAWNLYGAGADEILVRYQPDTAAGNYIHVHYHLDAMGNVQFLLSEENLGLEKYTYDAFGRPRITGWGDDNHSRGVSAYGNRFLFTGREYIYTLGIYDYRRRHYHPGLGRFMQTDPTGLQIEGAKLSAQVAALYPAGQAPEKFSASEINLYRYCHNDPTNSSDPTGLTVESNFRFLLRWLFGLGSSQDNYKEDSVQTREMANSPGAKTLKDKFEDGNRKDVRHAYGTTQAYKDTVINPKTADWSKTGAQVGGFAGATAKNNGDGTATYQIKNTAGANSFFYHRMPNSPFSSGPMRNINQTFTWTERFAAPPATEFQCQDFN